jgi:rod shape determining protein RodA
VIQSKIAIGAGQITGRGFLQGTQTKFGYVPAQSTDFIFSTIGEEWGFIGSFVVIGLFHIFNTQELIAAVFNLAGYTYGPLLGLFSFGLFTKYGVKDKLVPFICMASPIITFILEMQAQTLFGGFGFAKLILNGAVCFLMLWLIRRDRVIA